MVVESKAIHPSTPSASPTLAVEPPRDIGLDASMWSLDAGGGFDDCDVPLMADSPSSSIPTSLAGALTPPARSATATPVLAPEPLATISQLFDSIVHHWQPSMPTPLDCGIVAIGWGLTAGAAGYFCKDAYFASFIAGVSVLGTTLAAAVMHGADALYTPRFGSASPCGTVHVAAGYLVVGMFATSSWQRITS